MRRSQRLFLVYLVGLTLSGAALVLCLPRLFDAASPLPAWLPLLLGVGVLACGLGARATRPTAR